MSRSPSPWRGRRPGSARCRRGGWWWPSGGTSADALVGLGLRRAGGGLGEAAHDGAPRQLDLEGVVPVGLGLREDQVRGGAEGFGRRRPAFEARLRLAVAPGLVG